MTSQSITDRLNAIQHTISGTGIEKAVYKATTEQMISPKWKHLQYLIQSSNSSNISISGIAIALLERSQHSNWVVVFKSLITCHKLIRSGNERLIQYLASSSSTFNLQNFSDKKNADGHLMSTYIRRYSHYLNMKFLTYQKLGIDFTRIEINMDHYFNRNDTTLLLKTIPVIHDLIHALFEFRPNPHDQHNSIINAAFQLLYADAISVYSVYNKSMIALLEVYFKLSLINCRESLTMYKQYLDKMKVMENFLSVANRVGNGIEQKHPDLTQAPISILPKLEEHIRMLEGKVRPKSITEVRHLAESMANKKNADTCSYSTDRSRGSDNSRIEKMSDSWKPKEIDNNIDVIKRSIIEDERRELERLKKNKLIEKSNYHYESTPTRSLTPQMDFDFDVHFTHSLVENEFKKIDSPKKDIPDLFDASTEISKPQATKKDSIIDLLDFGFNSTSTSQLNSINLLKPQEIDTPPKFADVIIEPRKDSKTQERKLISSDIDESVLTLIDNLAITTTSGSSGNSNKFINWKNDDQQPKMMTKSLSKDSKLCRTDQQIDKNEIVSLFENNESTDSKKMSFSFFK
ncbi:hypothetical protein A3Q56_06435 [Intoshia linei]|uniref:ENTH domain-containing protein n=1 Tax=Intoshia linei TaxID=1819745 RepID=A0A177AVI9_9BILA|nr:hypothetical protein A3Q56_06435 [Intoshia linei]